MIWLLNKTKVFWMSLDTYRHITALSLLFEFANDLSETLVYASSSGFLYTSITDMSTITYLTISLHNLNIICYQNTQVEWWPQMKPRASMEINTLQIKMIQCLICWTYFFFIFEYTFPIVFYIAFLTNSLKLK